jgi:hypothetical protein
MSLHFGSNDITVGKSAYQAAKEAGYTGTETQYNQSMANQIQTYTHSKSGTVHNLVGNGSNIEFLTTASYDKGDTFTVNGNPVVARMQDSATEQSSSPLPNNFFTAGNWVTGVKLYAGYLFFPSIDGTLWSSKANLISTPQKTVESMTYYVDANSGNDDNNNGLTLSSPLKTVQAAIDSLPEVINSDIEINVANNYITWASRSYDITWRDIIYGSDKFIAVSNSSLYIYSTDGITWTSSVLPLDSCNCIAYGNNKYVAMGYNYSSNFAYSTDGITWTKSTLPCSNSWSCITYGGGKFVSLGCGSSSFVYSTDGVTWTQGTMPDRDSFDFSSIAYGNSKFVVFANGSYEYSYSSDGITWTNSSEGLGGKQYGNVIYGNSKFIASNSVNYIYSTDGITWTQGTFPSISTSWTSLTYGNNKFVAVASDNVFAYSTDGITWTQGTLPSNKSSNKTTNLAYGNNKFVATGYYVYNCSFAYSTDGITWAYSIPINLSWYSLTCNTTNIQLVAVGSGSNISAYSTEMAIWNISILPSVANWKSVTYGNSKFVAVASDSTAAAYSADGITWTASTLPSSLQWKSVTYGNGKFVTIAQGTTSAAYSTDGITWTAVILPNSSYDLVYGNSKFVAVGAAQSTYSYSTDGVTWTSGTLPSSQNWENIGYANKFIATVYNSNIFAYSTDGVTWTQGTLPASGEWIRVSYNGSKLVLIDYLSNKCLLSSDGIIWDTSTTLYVNGGCGYEDIVYDGSFFQALSTEGISESIYGILTVNSTAEDIQISGFTGNQEIRILGSSNLSGASDYIINSLEVYNNKCPVYITGFAAKSSETNHTEQSYEFIANNSSAVSIYNCISSLGHFDGTVGIGAINSSLDIDNCTVSNSTYGIHSSELANIIISNISGSGNTYALYCDTGGTINRDSASSITGTYMLNNSTLSERKVIGQNGICVAGTVSNITYYVNSSTGVDTNDGLTSGAAFKTIQHAVSLIPQVVNHNVVINLAAGTYAETVSLLGFVGHGGITISGGADTTAALNYIVTSIVFNMVGVCTEIKGVTSDYYVIQSTRVILSHCAASDASAYGLNVIAAKVFINVGVISNKSDAITTGENAEVMVLGLTGSNNTNVFTANYGSKISICDTTTLFGISGTNMFNPINGGEIIGPDGKSTSGYSPNLLINGDFNINQRGTSTYTASGYTVDRWYNSFTAGKLVTSITKAYQNAYTNNSYLQMNLSSVSANGGNISIYQSLEDNSNGCSPLCGKTVTFSVGIDSLVDYLQLFIEYYPTSTGSPVDIVFPLPNVTNSSSGNRYSVTANIPALNGCKVRCGISSSRSITTSDTLKLIAAIWEAKLEVGSVPTPFVPRPYAEELALCQRYYQSTDSGLAHAVCGTGMVCGERFTVPMRTTPTVTIYGWNGTTNVLNEIQLSGTTTDYPATVYANSDNICYIKCNNATVGGPGYHYGYWADAEIYS